MYTFNDRPVNDRSEPIIQAFRTGVRSGGTQCGCGRINYPAQPSGPDRYSQADIDALDQAAAAAPDRHVRHDHSQTLDIYTLQGVVFVDGCPCRTLARHERFLLQHQSEILVYYVSLDGGRNTIEEILDRLGDDHGSPR